MSNLPQIDQAQPFSFDHPMIKLLIERVTNVARKVTQDDCMKSTTLRTAAEWYARYYTGNFEYMVSMHGNLRRWGKLTPAQCAGVINCLMAEYRYQAKRAEQQAKLEAKPNYPHPITPEELLPANLPTVASPVIPNQQPTKVSPLCPDGYYTVVLNEKGDYRTLRLRTIKPDDLGTKPIGTQIASYLSGADNETNYTRFAFIFGDRVGIFANHKADTTSAKALDTLLKLNSDDRADCGQAYALESGNCWRCGRKLTVPASISRGLGPDCAAILGL
jgi:hypothetical protein